MLKKLLFFMFIVFITIAFTFSHENYSEIDSDYDLLVDDTNRVELQIIVNYFYSVLGITKLDLEEYQFNNFFQEFDNTKDLFHNS